MAHELSFNFNGEAEMFSGGNVVPWHGLGTILDHFPTSDEIKEENIGGIGWSAEMVPLSTRVSGTDFGPEYDGLEIPDRFAIVRSDTHRVIGVVGSRYKIVQNSEAFDFLDGLHQDGIIRYESAGCLRGGSNVWVLARMPSIDTIAEGDDSLRYVLFSTSHDGSKQLYAILTAVRVVCANTLRAATAQNIGFRHSGDVAEKLRQAKLYISQFDAQFTEFRDSARVIATRQYSEGQAKEFLMTLFPAPKVPGADEDRSTRGLTIQQNKIDATLRALRGERCQLRSIAGSWWSLYNAVSEAVDHDFSVKSSKRDRRVNDENRMMTLTDGPMADFKSRAFALAVEMSA